MDGKDPVVDHSIMDTVRYPSAEEFGIVRTGAFGLSFGARSLFPSVSDMAANASQKPRTIADGFHQSSTFSLGSAEPLIIPAADTPKVKEEATAGLDVFPSKSNGSQELLSVNGADLVTSNVLLSKFCRRSQINELITQLMKDSIASSLEWRSFSARRKKASTKAKRVRPPSMSKVKPIVSVKKFKISVKKSSIALTVDKEKLEQTEKEKSAVTAMLFAQQTEKNNRDAARKASLADLLDKLKKRDKMKFFHLPVDIKLVPDYLEIIQNPMDFSAVKVKIDRGRYSSVDAFKSDIELICRNCMVYNHPLTLFYQQAESMLTYIARACSEVKRLLEPEETPPLIHPYTTLDAVVMAVDEEECRTKLSTNKWGRCDGKHCLSYEAIGAYDVNRFRFDSLCSDRINMTECSDDCKCDPNVCLNRPVSLLQYKQLTVDIDKRNVFGIDAHTHALIRKALEDSGGCSNEEPSAFIEKMILPYINCHIPFDANTRRTIHMAHALKAMLADAQRLGDAAAEGNAKCLLKHIKAGLSLPVYDKGHGVICLKAEGFKKNEFIAEYLGEVYPAWRWFEKQGVLKAFQKVYMMPFSFGFYNIMLERHKDDNMGYDVLYLDACRKGNFASRLSHSCSPNCTSVIVAANGRFAIVVLALRDIAPNEELTFDYHSVTESPQEAKNAVCFCGWSSCRGRYVTYSGPDTFQQVLTNHHGFLQRTAMLLQACVEPLNSNDHNRLKKWRFLGSTLNGLPDWAAKFASLALEYVEYEKAALPLELVALSRFNYTRESAEFDTYGVTEGRLQSLAIALDKVKYILRQPDQIKDPPIRVLTNEEVIERIWNSDDSVVATAAKKIGPLLDDVDLVRLIECTNYKVMSRREMVSRLIEFRDLLRSMQPSTSCFHHVAADIVHMYAYTDTFYCLTSYNPVKSLPIHFSELGLNITDPDDENLMTPKPYTQAYVWGTLMYWFKQSIDRPDATAHNAKRGSVCLPSIEGCYTTSSRHDLSEKYTIIQRDAMIACLSSTPVGSIPRHPVWDYRQTNERVYGSPMLDSCYKKKDLKALIKGLQAWQPAVDADGVFDVVQSPKRRRRRIVRT